MASGEITKYPVYVISKGRWNNGLTAKFLIKDEIPFNLVVEPQEFDNYHSIFGGSKYCTILQLPFSNLGLGSIPARNWCWEHSIINGYKRHWILDDNIRGMRTWKNNRRVACHSLDAFKTLEGFVDKFKNIAISGINYTMNGGPIRLPKFYLNCHVYSFILILNKLPFRWRGRYNEDTDLCLQALTQNWCTLNLNIYLCDKMATMTMKGGNTDELYKGRGRLAMAKSLELAWVKYPGLVKTIRRFNRPQHHVNWKVFKTPLIRNEP